MAYCTYANVASEFKNTTFSATSPVTDTEVTDIITQTDAEIDARLSTVYQTPITGASSIILLKTISIYISAARVSKIIEIKTGESDKDQPRRVEERLAAEKMLQDIIKGVLPLVDATKKVSTGGVRSYTSDNTCIKPVFDVTKDQW